MGAVGSAPDATARSVPLDPKKCKHASFTCADAKRLRCAPVQGTPFVPGCSVKCGTTVDVLPGGTEKYSVVRVHGMLGYLRSSHLVPITMTGHVKKSRRKAAIVVWILSRFFQLSPRCCADVASVFAPELVPYWLLPGQPEQDISTRMFCEVMLSDKRKRRFSKPAFRRIELASQLMGWKETFRSKYRRNPLLADILDDPNASKWHQEYVRLGDEEALRRERSARRQRRQKLADKIRSWKAEFKESHGYSPDRNMILDNPVTGPLYKEYLALKHQDAPSPPVAPSEAKEGPAKPSADSQASNKSSDPEKMERAVKRGCIAEARKWCREERHDSAENSSVDGDAQERTEEAASSSSPPASPTRTLVTWHGNVPAIHTSPPGS